MKIEILSVGITLCLFSCQDYNSNNTITQQDKLKQYIESKEDFEASENFIPADKFIFLEVIEFQTAKVISGKSKLIRIPTRFIDFPMYSYNDSLKKLKTWDSQFKFDREKVKLIIGKGLILGENRGSGGATRLYGINYFPYFNEETGVYEIDKSGNIYLRHKNIYYMISSGKTLIDSSFFNMKIDGTQGGEIRVKKEIRISNHGLVNKDAIIFDTLKRK